MKVTKHPAPMFQESWLGKLPEGWRVVKLRGILKRTNERNRPDWPLLSVVRERGVVLRDTENDDENHNFIPDDLTNYKVVRRGQLAMNKMKAWQGSYGISPMDGIVSPAYFVFDVKDVNDGYFHRAIRSRAYVPFFQRASDGVRIGQWDLSPEQMREIPFLIPSPEEQAAIVRFLDHADEQIQRYIAAKERLIALLEEQRQAVIHQAVTRGLDPNVRLKDSGVEWLVEVPEHWKVRRAKYLYREVDERSNTGAEQLMSVSHKTGVTPRKQNVTMFLAESNIGHKICIPGDIVVNTMWAYMAALGVAPQHGLVSPSYNVYRPYSGTRLSSNYVDPLLRTEAYRRNYLIRSTGITSSRLRLYPDSFLDIPFLCPPSTEQDEIVEYLGQATTATDDAIRRSRHQIDLINEYRTRLIADVVTGQLDVREAADRLAESGTVDPRPGHQTPSFATT